MDINSCCVEYTFDPLRVQPSTWVILCQDLSQQVAAYGGYLVSFEQGRMMYTAGADVAEIVHEEVHKLIQNSLHAPGVAALPMTGQMIRDYKVSRAMHRGFHMLQVYRLKGDEDLQQLRNSLEQVSSAGACLMAAGTCLMAVT